MKQLSILLFSLSLCIYAFAQDAPKLNDLKTPNSPGFQILDISPSSIERPSNPKEFSLKVLNLVGNGTALPKNFAFEVSPFWFTKNNIENDNVYSYLNITKNAGATKNQLYFYSGILQKFTVSACSYFADSISATLLNNTNYAAIGFRTNLLTIRTGKQNQDLEASVLAAAKRMSAYSGIAGTGITLTPTQINKGLEADKEFKKYIEVLSKLPLIQLDAAYAYSHAFRNNVYSENRFHRSGFWATLAFNAQFKQTNHSLSFIGLFKSSSDNLLSDTTEQIFKKKNFTDFGGKLEYNVSRFNLSMEYVKRKYKDDAEMYNTDRTVAILQYKINDNLYFTGTFGKNFGEQGSLFSVFGINWGFGTAPLDLK